MRSNRVPRADPRSRPLTFAEGLDAVVRRLGDPSPSAVRIVAVDGHSGAGKSTFAAALAARIVATLVPGDDFYRVMDDEVRARLSAHEGIGRYFDWERMRDEVLVPLLAGRDARYRLFDWDSGLLAETPITLPRAPLVVLDGVYTSRPELARFLHLSVLVEAPADVRRKRQVTRGDSPDWLRRWEEAERLFFAQLRPVESFDLVVSGNEYRY
jgi:uridine kinase